mmetsp:Transcript_46141/g.128363  ORF Transcript_46141/g.128363 Transcript_46141/m.128363 type:complete len:235 (+) Transcript_46141:930-1634(+)
MQRRSTPSWLKPALSRPLRSSSRVSRPSPLASSDSKAARRSWTLSSLSCRATTFSTARSSLLRAQKSCSLSTKPLPNLTFRTSGTLCTIQGCSKACCAVKRSLGLILSSWRMRSLASVLTRRQDEASRYTRPRRILAKISVSVWPLNGGRPLRSAYKVTPRLHRSHCLSYLPMSTCGATYRAVPARVFSQAPGLQEVAKPKSMSLRVLPSKGPFLCNKKFCGLRSRCAMSLLWT